MGEDGVPKKGRFAPKKISILDLETVLSNEKNRNMVQNDGLDETVLTSPIIAFFVTKVC